ncbi:MAG: HAMP domain-containing sensor histidine kinase [Nitrosopumilus sp.]
MKFDKFLQGVIFLIISITSVSIIIISSVLSDIDDRAELDSTMNAYAQQKTKSMLDAINETHLELDIIARYVSENLSYDKISNQNTNSLNSDKFVLIMERISGIHGNISNIIIFVDEVPLQSYKNVQYLDYNEIDFSKKFQLFKNGEILVSNVEIDSKFGQKINVVAIEKTYSLFYEQDRAYDILISGHLDGVFFGNIPEDNFTTYRYIIPIYPNEEIQEHFQFEFHIENANETGFTQWVSLLISISIPLSFAPLIAALVSRKFSSNIESLLQISKREKTKSNFTFDELDKVADEINDDRFNLELANKTLNEQILQLNNINSQKELFNSAISHSMKTSLVTIQGYSEMLLETETNPSQRKILENIVDSSQKLKIQINNILQSFKDEQSFNLQGVAVEDTDIEEISSIIKNTYSNMFRLNDVDFKIITKTKNLKFGTHKTVLIQILGNLFTNAIEFSKVEKTVSLEINSDDSKIYFIVSDKGQGIQKEYQNSLFSKYSNTSLNLNRMYGGAGLGLYISKQLAKGLGGDLYLTKSEIGKGSIFTLEIPNN